MTKQLLIHLLVYCYCFWLTNYFFNENACILKNCSIFIRFSPLLFLPECVKVYIVYLLDKITRFISKLYQEKYNNNKYLVQQTNWTVPTLYLNCTWIVHELYLNLTWTIHEPYMDCTRVFFTVHVQFIYSSLRGICNFSKGFFFFLRALLYALMF